MSLSQTSMACSCQRARMELSGDGIWRYVAPRWPVLLQGHCPLELDHFQAHSIQLHSTLLRRGILVLQTGKVKEEAKLHDKEIRDMQLYKDGTHMVTASVDKLVKLVDTQTLEVLKVFQTDRPANAAALSPIFDQVRLRKHAESF